MNTRSETSDPFGDTDTEDTGLSGLFEPMPLPPLRRQALRAGLPERVARSVAEHSGLITIRARHGAWHSLKPGIRYKPLWSGPEGNSVLIEFAAGTRLPIHRHRWLEEGIVLRGDLYMGELCLGRYDYHVSPVGSRHGRIGSRGGALAYLRGTSLGDTVSVLGEMLGGFLPHAGPPARTVFASDNGWETVAPGVARKRLWSDARMASYFFRLAPGAEVAGHEHPLDEECIMLEGDVFLGDILLGVGEYQVAPAGTRHGLAHSDSGALLYVRGARETFGE